MSCSIDRFVSLLRNLAGFLWTLSLLIATQLSEAQEAVPLPRERPRLDTQNSSANSSIDLAPSPCQLRLAELAAFKAKPPILGPGECSATDVVELSAVNLPDKGRVIFSPAATLRCSMAEAVAHWIRDDVEPAIAAMAAPLRDLEVFGSYECRSFNGISGAHLSEHGHANALDIRSFKLANGTVIELTNPVTSKSSREKLRQSACARFSTVLGNGADAFHESHVHIDLMERANHYKICQWDVLDPSQTAALMARKAAARSPSAASANMGEDVPLPRPRPHLKKDSSNLAQPESHYKRARKGRLIFSPFAPLSETHVQWTWPLNPILVPRSHCATWPRCGYLRRL